MTSQPHGMNPTLLQQLAQKTTFDKAQSQGNATLGIRPRAGRHGAMAEIKLDAVNSVVNELP